MAWLREILQHKDALLRGLALLVGGVALILVGTFVGLEGSRTAQIIAGTIAATGLCVAFLGFFIYIVPPLLPAK